MSKKLKNLRALQVTALLSAVSGATLIMSASAPVKAAEESCWEQPTTATTDERYLRGCAYNQYGLTTRLRPADGGENGPTDVDTPETGGGGGGGGTPVDPYRSGQ